MPWSRCRAAFAATALFAAGAVEAAATRKAPPKPAPAPVDDLSVPAIRHVANCPLPKLGACIIRKPVDNGYRVLTAGTELEDKGDHWIADFARNTEAKFLLRVLGRNGDLHEIEVSFGGKAAKAINLPQPKGDPK